MAIVALVHGVDVETVVSWAKELVQRAFCSKKNTTEAERQVSRLS